LVIDEVHEWNTNIETLLAWSKQKIKENPEFKVVIMSATFDASRMQDYFNYDLDKPTKSKVIDIPGKIYPVETVDKEEEEYLTSIIQEAEQ
jgi:HrpA-like RNA helicase